MGTKIPSGPIVVYTKNSVYRFGAANKKGERTISRDSRPLECTRCRIVKLGQGHSMNFIDIDGPNAGEEWTTSFVTKIELQE